MAASFTDQLNTYLDLVKKGIEDQDPTIISVLIAAAVVFLTIIILVLRGGQKKKKGVLLVGLCDAGKTLIYTRLVLGRFMRTHTSIKENLGAYTTKGEKARELTIVDLPGHERLRMRYFDQHKASAGSVIFVVDSLTFQKEVKDVAEFIYNLLATGGCPRNVLIACNKQDQTLAKGSKVIKSQLEKEMNTLRVTRSAALQGTDDSSNNNTFLGKRNKDFEFTDIRPIKVTFVECSAQGSQTGSGDGAEAEMDAVHQWLYSIA